MQQQRTITSTRVFFHELPQDEQQLIEAALAVRLNAYVPYSNFLVGAAVLSDRGTIHRGCNVERCSYTQTTHAEQNALDTMIATHGECTITKLAVVGALRTTRVAIGDACDPLECMPCGQCLQIIQEHSASTQTKILALQAGGQVLCTTIADMLPFAFTTHNLQPIAGNLGADALKQVML